MCAYLYLYLYSHRNVKHNYYGVCIVNACHTKTVTITTVTVVTVTTTTVAVITILSVHLTVMCIHLYACNNVPVRHGYVYML